MIRKSSKYKGVYQRCKTSCPPDQCSKHRWSYHVELPAGPDGKRRQLTCHPRGIFALE